jgi:CBS domain-containing protein
MTQRKLAYIIKDQNPLVLPLDQTVEHACRCMRERSVGSVLVVDSRKRLVGILTGRDVVRIVAEGHNATQTSLSAAMTRNPRTVTPDSPAIDALRKMSEGGFRHVPVVENETIWGIVSRGDFKGIEIDRLDEEEHLWECIR